MSTDIHDKDISPTTCTFDDLLTVAFFQTGIDTVTYTVTVLCSARLKAHTHRPDVQLPYPLSEHSVASCLTCSAEKLH